MYQPAPAWVKPAPAVDAAKLTGDAPVLLLFDNQQRLEDGRVWSYVESAARAASTEALGSIGTIQLQWQPSQGDLIVHRAEIIRGAEHIDLIKGGNPLTVLRREQGMEQRILDGRLTATMPVEGLRVGDVLHLAFSVTRRDPTLKGDMQAFAPLMFAPTRVGFARVRLSWPAKSDVRWKSYVDGLSARPVVENGYDTLDVTLPLPKQPDMPTDAPARFAKLPIIEASSFADWAAVSKVMAPLYATEGLIAPGSPLAAEVARIKAAERSAQARRARAATGAGEDPLFAHGHGHRQLRAPVAGQDLGGALRRLQGEDAVAARPAPRAWGSRRSRCSPIPSLATWCRRGCPARRRSTMCSSARR